MRERILRVTIKDCEVQTFRAGGKGGQHQNKTDSGVRVVHRPSGARGESREERSQGKNKRTAFVRMAKTAAFQGWIRREHARHVGELDAWVENELREENLIIQTGAAALL